MCGIAGFIVTTPPTQPQVTLQNMATVLQHRGPDDEGIYLSSDQRVGFANRRLAIRDLSSAGHMPMTNPQETVCITYNGEIFNAEALRDELLAAGCAFRSHSDTEVILRGYEQWGAEVVPRLRGQFAFALHDVARQRVLIARDHLGIKPLYYVQVPQMGGLLFASELKALLASGLVSHEWDPTALQEYLAFGSVPNPRTIYRDVHALQPATLAFIDLHAPQMNLQVYWSLPTDVQAADDPVAMTRLALQRAVQMRLVSDVPLGAFLSGGLDSTTVVALMRHSLPDATIRTCSMVFEEARYSEKPYIDAVANALRTEHYERIVTADDVEQSFDHLLAALDQPSVDGINTYFVSQTAREAGLTVALSGLGGDELFGGYPNTFEQVPRIRQLLRMAETVPGGQTIGRHLIDQLPSSRRAGWLRVQDALRGSASLSDAYLTRRGLFTDAEIRSLVHPDVWHPDAVPGLREHIRERAGGDDRTADPFAWISRAELRTYTHHQLLRDTDAMSMAHSLEVRVPLLDADLVEMILRLPTSVKTSADGTIKPLLNAAVAGLVPDVIRERRDKMGFTFPFDIWLRGPLQARIRNVFDTVTAHSFIDAAGAQALYARYLSGEAHWSRVWTLVALGAALHD